MRFDIIIHDAKNAETADYYPREIALTNLNRVIILGNTLQSCTERTQPYALKESLLAIFNIHSVCIYLLYL